MPVDIESLPFFRPKLQSDFHKDTSKERRNVKCLKTWICFKAECKNSLYLLIAMHFLNLPAVGFMIRLKKAEDVPQRHFLSSKVEMNSLTTLLLLICTTWCHAELFEGDILLDPKTQQIVDGMTTFDAVKSETQKWTNARVPYIFDSNFDSQRRQVVQQAINEYNKYTCIRFVPRTNEKNYVKFIIGGGCYSYIGMLGGEQPISIGQGCEYKGIVMHEMMHASGFWHEQSRLDRDSYIRVFWDNVSGGKKNYNFRKYTHGEADYYGEGYDYDSVMHYGNWDFSSNDEMTLQAINDPNRILGQRDGFSQTDVNQLNKVYKCKGYENVKVPPLKGCIDRHQRCAEWADWGECSRNKPYMLVNCCKSCKENGSGSSCKDDNTNCPMWAQWGHCKIAPGYMLVNCKKSCNVC